MLMSHASEEVSTDYPELGLNMLFFPLKIPLKVKEKMQREELR